MSSPFIIHLKWQSCLCVASIWVAEEKEEGSDKAVILQRWYAWFHLLHLLFVSAPFNLFVCLLWSQSNLEKVALRSPHLNSTLSRLTSLYAKSFFSLPLFSKKVVTAIGSFLPWKRQASTLTENRISMKNQWLRQMWCLCVYVSDTESPIWAWLILGLPICPGVHKHTGSEPKYCREKQHLC